MTIDGLEEDTRSALEPTPCFASYFESIGEEFSEQSWYPDLTSFAGLGEDPYPSVVDTLGALTLRTLREATIRCNTDSQNSRRAPARLYCLELMSRH